MFNLENRSWQTRASLASAFWILLALVVILLLEPRLGGWAQIVGGVIAVAGSEQSLKRAWESRRGSD